MVNTIKIGTKDVQLKSTATTAFRYKQIFGTDLKKDMVKLSEELKDMKDDGSRGLDMVYMVMQLAYIMHCQADNSIKDAAVEKYYDWLDEYEEDNFMNVDTIYNILGSWNKSLETTSELKNQQSPQIER